MNEHRMVVDTADGPMSARVLSPDADGPHPVVLCYHDGPGLRESIYDTARRIAADGYCVAVPDLYHRDGEEIRFDLSRMRDPDSPERARMEAAIGNATPSRMVADSVTLLEALADHPAAAAGAVGCLGFCHTARTVIHAMAEHGEVFTAGAMLHPAFTVADAPDSPHLRVKEIRGDVYAAFGGVDAVVPLPDQRPLIDELEKLGRRATVEIHAKGGHGFLWPGTPAHDPAGAAASWAQMLALFGRRLRDAATV
ncbi:dienelactone hydrolase family protein [Streptomyces sp. NPDC048002]|uniref:dienelactone hydrolase family protein n=1 Tax=Streptomyces sp. NPDC048002 TaxID=3154344 RepID=UPI0033D0A291